MLAQAAQWIAPAATMIAAIMTAANLGARVTGWGFVVFSIGGVAWIVVGIAGGQQNLLVSNAFLLLVDLVGIWRWLGRQARYQDGAQAAEQLSRRFGQPALFALSKIEGQPVHDGKGERIATIVDAMAGCDDGAIRYFVVTRGGIGGVGEQLHALGWREATIGEGRLDTMVEAETLDARPAIDPEHWPPSARSAGVTGG